MKSLDNLFKKYNKGDYEYASYDKKKTGIITLLLFILPLGLYITGYVTTGSNKNLLTVVAILGMLPASRSLVSFIMKLKVKTATPALRDIINENIGETLGLYNMYLTSYDVNFYFEHMIILQNSLICLSKSEKFDNKKFNEHLEKHMKLEGIKDIMIKVFSDEDTYVRRLKEIKDSETIKGTNEALYKLICSISL